MELERMDLSRLPLAVVEEIERFVQPWRTYKKEEADLITWHCMWLEYEIREKNLHFPEDGLVLHGCGRVSRFQGTAFRGSAPDLGHQVRLGDGYRYVRRFIG